MHSLTARQLRIARLISEGLNDAEIAERLGIMERTVRSHSDAIKAGLGVSRKREIPDAMRRQGLLEELP